MEALQPVLAQAEPANVAYDVATEQQSLQKAEVLTHFQSPDLTEQIQSWMRSEVARLLKMSLEDVDIDSEFSEFGFDSISLTEFGEELSRDGTLELSPTVFFEYPTIASFAAYLAQAHSDVFIKRFGIHMQPGSSLVVERKVANTSVAVPVQEMNASQNVDVVGRMTWLSELSDVPARTESYESPRQEKRKVAVIGMSGCFPGAKDIQEYWDNLCNGKDCISEIPASRWNWQELEERGVTSMKWGGFIEGVEFFDAGFFDISSLEAQLMDPQHRLMLTHVWQTIDDAGYAPHQLAGSDTAIFVGTANTGYSELLTSNGLSSASMVPSMGPARVSYLLNIHGPSEPVETACSSALVAIHKAVELIGSGKSQMAFAGGINTLLSPLVHASFDRVGMLSSDGKCKSFGQNANGYVRGEGVGVLLLKSLSHAEQDGDHIYGVICGSAVNHGGRATSLTAPNPRAQAQLIEAAYKDAGVDPRTVGYIEAHGTGTDLGDPIEVNALKSAFKNLYDNTADHTQRQQDYSVPYCALGSVKSNIGHLELAAGAAAIIKTLLQVKHKTLAASLHSEQENPHVKLAQSPFYLVKETQPWQTLTAHDGAVLPRRAGVSSFGFGGVNAHIVVEEYVPKSVPRRVEEKSYLIVISAKSQRALDRRIETLLHGIEHANISENRLCDVAYTLQQGREAMPYRWASVVSNYKELIGALRSSQEQRPNFGVLRTEQIQSKEILNTLFKDDGFSSLLKEWIKQGKAQKVLELWVSGMAINWQELQAADGCQRVSLPSYPFEEQRYWFDDLIQSPNSVSFKQTKPVVEKSEQVERVKILTKPRNDIERELLVIWQDLLDRQDICVLDNFFDLGGSSIQASLMVTRVKRRLKLQLDVAVLFQNPNIESLAEMLKQAHTCDDESIPAQGLTQGPLSFAQVRLWLSEKIIGQSSIYNMPMTLRLSGFLNYQAMSKSLEEIVARHSILRTRFVEEHGEPKQCIDSTQSWSMQLVDKRDVEHEQVTAWVQHWHSQPYQLDEESGFRAALVICAEHEHLLLINMHHIISDGWSMQVLNYELNALYRAKVANEPLALPELPIQYIDYADWQHQEADNGVTTAQLYYWKTALQGMPKVLSLPLDYPRPAIQKHQGVNFRFSFGERISVLVSQFSRQHRVTPFMSLLAVYYVHLYELTGQLDIAVGTASANRGRTELEGLIGFFVNTLVLRGRIKTEMTFDALVAQVKSTTLSAFANQEITFEQIVEHLNPERSTSYSPLFQVYFSYVDLDQKGFDAQPTWDGSAIEDIAVEMCESQNGVIAQYDMSLSISESESGLQGCLNYDIDLFCEQSIEHMMNDYMALVERLLSNSGAPLGVGSRTITDSQTKAPSLTATPPVLDSFISRFNAQALRTPNADALVVDGQRYRFSDVDKRANQVAHYLVSRGINRSSKVGLYLKRESWLIPSLLGVLKAGAAYVPLDPELPAARLQLIIEQGELDLVICNIHQPKVSVPYMDISNVDWEKLPNTTSDVTVEPQDNAYIIFTSGSTGVPKGVVIQHSALVNFIDGLRDVVGVISAERVLLNASTVFDASVQQIVQLCLGSTLYLIDEETRLSPQKMTEFLIENRIERMDCTPQQLKLLVQYWHATHCPTNLRTVLVGGEELDQVLWQQLNLLTEQTGCRFYNMYGPTECTVDATCAVIHEHDVPVLGQPLSNIDCYILDEKMTMCGPQEIGELYLSGKSLALGYINQPELTAQKFVPNPFSNVSGERMYRTGDLVMRSDDGQLMYVGRNDHQVKVRGHRIELGEIVNASKRLVGVQDAVIVTNKQLINAKVRAGTLAKEEHPSAVERLIAYILPQSGVDTSCLESETLRSQLKANLMDYMIPNVFVTVDSIPLTLNGKVSLAELPIPNGALQSNNSYAKPQSVIEKQLVQLWEDVLGVKPIGINDNFFDLGGHSLLAVQVITRLQQQLPYSTDVMALFANPTVAKLAQHLSQHQNNHTVVEITAQGQSQGPLSHEQFRLWLSEKMFGNSNVYNMPITLRLEGALDIVALERSLADIVVRHSVLRTRFVEHNGQPLQVIDSSEDWSLKKVNKSMETDEDIAAWTSRWHQLTYKLDVESGFRVVLVERSASEFLLLVNMHHIVSDGWSIQLFNYELNVLYQAHAQGQQPNLPRLPIQYIDYALWQHSDIAKTKNSEQLEYWKQTLTGLPTLLSLQTDKPRPAIQTFKGRDYAFDFGAEHRTLVEAFAQRHKVTPFMCLLAVFSVQLSLLSGQNDIGVGTASANRHRSELEGLVGFFVNTLVLRIQLTQQQTFHDLVEHVKKMTAGAFANQDVTFEQIVSHLSPKRDVSHSPLFQVYFSYVGKDQTQLVNEYEQPNQHVTSKDMSVSSVDVENTIAQYDISLVVTDDGEGLSGTVNFNTDLFEEHTIAKLAEQYGRLVKRLFSSPDDPIKQGIDAESNECVSSALLDNHSVAAEPSSFLKEFETQVEQNGQQIALTDGEHHETYATLNRKAEQFAKGLVAQGIGQETFVALCMPKSYRLLIALLGTLKAGAAYVPIDLKLPKRRQVLIINDCKPKLVITDGVDDTLNEHKLAIQYADVFAASKQEIALPEEVLANQTMYVIYTSGSTGEPKGVVNTHGAVSAFVHSAVDTYQISKDSRVMQFASISFDAAVEEILCTWYAGGRLILKPDEVVIDFEKLERLCVEQEITLLDLPTSVFHNYVSWKRQISETSPSSEWLPACVESVIIGGEKAQIELVKQWRLAMPQCRLFNTYGPTEASVVATVFEVTDASILTDVPIGKPLNGVSIYVLDGNLALVGDGEVGELYIAGSTLARGYLNKPKATASHWLTNPFSNDAGRMYRTGDLVKKNHNGDLEFMGRVDNQVKLRGFRVELGDIEAALLQNQKVLQAKVMLLEDASAPKLVAFVHTHYQKLVKTQCDDIRDCLAAILPNYMIPARFYEVGELPLTTNGKIDTQALLRYSKSDQECKQTVVQHDDIENRLQHVWQDLLATEHIDIHDNFFQIGGSSLLVMDLFERIDQEFGCKLNINTILSNPTIAGFASILRHGAQQGNDNSSFTLLRKGVEQKKAICLLHPIGGTLLSYAALVNNWRTALPIYGFESPALDRTNDYNFTSVESIAEHYADQLLSDFTGNTVTLVGWSYGGVLSYELAKALSGSRISVDSVVMLDSYYDITDLFGNENVSALVTIALDMGISYQSLIPLLVQNDSFETTTQKVFNILKEDRKIHEEFCLSSFSHHLEVVKMQNTALNNYTPKEGYSGTVQYIKASETERSEKVWERYIEDLEVTVIQGDHYSLFKPPMMENVIEILNKSLKLA
ncbi:non-ribosomal peptide synthetase [Pseudoalteromonas holothuriae]|uniref:non-ribosomal peptide synthetase n=1 Tax=Pseudoalteromonas holothuriae TaxID=2963714 RepID=UPI0021BFF920|nr:non-ribosomal peptide synthetase [Pseudoalteromonas sp. CIP111951]